MSRPRILALERSILRLALSTWGRELQVSVLHEELAELLTVTARWVRGRMDVSIEDILEERVDVAIMLHQLDIMLEVTPNQVDAIRAEKLERLQRLLLDMADTYPPEWDDATQPPSQPTLAIEAGQVQAKGAPAPVHPPEQLQAILAAATPAPWHKGTAADPRYDDEERAWFFTGGGVGHREGLVGAALPWPTEVDSSDLRRVEANVDLIVLAPLLAQEVLQLRQERGAARREIVELKLRAEYGDRALAVAWREAWLNGALSELDMGDDPPTGVCEGCCRPAWQTDSEGVHLCPACFEDLEDLEVTGLPVVSDG